MTGSTSGVDASLEAASRRPALPEGASGRSNAEDAACCVGSSTFKTAGAGASGAISLATVIVDAGCRNLGLQAEAIIR